MTINVTRKPSQRTQSEPVFPRRKSAPVDDVELNSDESFPASDAPSWTPVARVGSPRASVSPEPSEVRR
jgi:hypothetical protein